MDKNYKIFQDWQAGVNGEALAQEYGVTRQRINQIVKAEAKRLGQTAQMRQTNKGYFIGTQVDADTKAQLIKASQYTHINQAEILRLALAAWLDQNLPKEAPVKDTIILT